MMPYENRVVIITGAGRGLGRAFAEGFMRDGATVVGFGRSVSSLEAVSVASRGAMHCVAGDLGRPEDVERLFAEVDNRFGRVDVLVNNAALYPRTPFVGTPIRDWAEVINVNVTGLAHCCMLAIPRMLAQKFGRIINVGSFAWRGSLPKSSSYAASKAAVTSLTRAIASEVDPASGVLINEFIPGIVRTGMSSEGLEPEAVYPHLRRVVSLPAGSPHGVVYLQGEVWDDYAGLRGRFRRLWAVLRKRFRGPSDRNR